MADLGMIKVGNSYYNPNSIARIQECSSKSVDGKKDVYLYVNHNTGLDNG